MARNTKLKGLIDPRQIRFDVETDKILREYAESEGIDYAQAARKAARLGSEILKKRIAQTLKAAA